MAISMQDILQLISGLAQRQGNKIQQPTMWNRAFPKPSNYVIENYPSFATLFEPYEEVKPEISKLYREIFGDLASIRNLDQLFKLAGINYPEQVLSAWGTNYKVPKTIEELSPFELRNMLNEAVAKGWLAGAGDKYIPAIQRIPSAQTLKQLTEAGELPRLKRILSTLGEDYASSWTDIIKGIAPTTSRKETARWAIPK